jgi:hypothetical protein
MSKNDAKKTRANIPNFYVLVHNDKNCFVVYLFFILFLSLQSVLEFLNNLWGLGTEKEKGCRTGPPGYTAWRNWFCGINS